MLKKVSLRYVVITVQGLLSLKPRCIINLTSRCLVLFQIHLMIRSSVKYLNQCFVCNLLPEEKKITGKEIGIHS